ncbi:hypothetical protein JMJ77_0007682 [Colletotrichum scovillei]|uniref:Uncharacterized protein n=1 Tax=Colletotrichum scovillei TaxID=1209932 RepID=A0A9P7RCR3_9PEZI|nr:hypothetical protein JMJ77_0007682 [Colletotrichum scovillei]KAG7074661.1 hypothetical protein JMJ76_0011135 [Colletotrichum scovillei]KAG7081810.1 hypothetical protein JMJ78_0003923 [Colletotrichum scovillei]
MCLQDLPVLSMSRPPTTQEVKVDAILFSNGHRSVRARCGEGRNALAIQVALFLHLRVPFLRHVSPMRPKALVTYDARGPVMPGGKEGQAGSAARRAREETRPVSALQRGIQRGRRKDVKSSISPSLRARRAGHDRQACGKASCGW